MDKIKLNPVRLYTIAVAVMAVLAHYLPSLPSALYLGVVAAVLGVGEGVRKAVTPNQTAEENVVKAYSKGVNVGTLRLRRR